MHFRDRPPLPPSDVPVYETRAASQEQREQLREGLANGSIDVALFTSSSTVTETIAALGSDAAAQLGRVTVASIGPVTTRTLVEAGVRVDVTASEYTVEGLLDALERHFAPASSDVSR